jgi:hypothetical protein
MGQWWDRGGGKVLVCTGSHEDHCDAPSVVFKGLRLLSRATDGGIMDAADAIWDVGYA